MAFARAALLLALAAAFAGGQRQAAAEEPAGALSCSGCHPPAAADVGLPSLEGLSAGEIEAAMQAFKAGERSPTVMDRIARGFSDEEIRAIAAWLGGSG
jgi:cytochrome subunit of sulfide dehydrogenase